MQWDLLVVVGCVVALGVAAALGIGRRGTAAGKRDGDAGSGDWDSDGDGGGD